MTPKYKIIIYAIIILFFGSAYYFNFLLPVVIGMAGVFVFLFFGIMVYHWTRD